MAGDAARAGRLRPELQRQRRGSHHAGGLAELIADVIKRPLVLVPAPTPAGGKPAPFGQNLVCDCHAVCYHDARASRAGRPPALPLAAGLAQTFAWYLREGLTAARWTLGEDALLRSLGA